MDVTSVDRTNFMLNISARPIALVDNFTMEELYFPTPATEDEMTTTWNENGTIISAVIQPEGPSLITIGHRIQLAFAFMTLIVGTIGNTLSFAVMCQKSMRGTSAATFLAAIAIGDSLVLYFGELPVVIRYVTGLGMKPFPISWWTCCGQWFSLYTSADIAVWLVLALTVDRFIAVWLPHRAKVLCTVNRAIGVCFLLTLLAVLKNISFLIVRSVADDHEGCKTVPSWEFYMQHVRPWLAFILYAFIPIVSVFVLNMLIIHRLVKVHRKATSEGRGSRSIASSSLTAMFFGVSIVFLVLVTPSMLNYAISAYRRETSVTFLVTLILDSLSYVNHSVNFFLYCLTGRRFRAVFMGMAATCFGRRPPEEKTSRTTTNADAVSATNLSRLPHVYITAATFVVLNDIPKHKFSILQHLLWYCMSCIPCVPHERGTDICWIYLHCILCLIFTCFYLCSQLCSQITVIP